MSIIYIDADACPVKDEVYRVAQRYAIRVIVVANSVMRVPRSELVQLVVKLAYGEVDDWIAEQVMVGDIVVTSDIPLAGRCLERNARVLNPKGHLLTDSDIGEALAMRDLMGELRLTGEASGGPSPMTPKDRSRFLSTLDELINAVRRQTP